MREAERQAAFTEQQKITTLSLISEIPSVVLRVVVAVASRSTILTLNAFDTICNCVQTVLTFAVSKRLQKDSTYVYDYGMGKIESLGSLVSTVLLYLGMVVVLVLSVFRLFEPEEPSDILSLGILMSIAGFCFEMYQYTRQKRLARKVNSSLSDAALMKYRKEITMDVVSFATLCVVLVLRAHPFTMYLEPAACILFIGYLMYINLPLLRRAVYDLLDKTADEDIQLKVLRCLAEYNDDYEGFHGVRTRTSGGIIYVDLLLGFGNDTTFDAIEATRQELEAAILNVIPNGDVSIVLRG